ncbi:MAG: hypothetical protein EOO17_03460 [Chloroflexi bacterium]|nr:MAG: hypothetical protein EOO17_03460 [Chloroflexota bacterium]
MFTETGSRNKEFISITSNKTFGLSRNFLDANKIGQHHKAVLYYDSEEKKVAFYFSMFETKNGLTIRVPDPRYGGTIVAKSFFDLNKIDTAIYGGRYDDVEEIDPGLLGASDIGGEAFVITLKAKEVAVKEAEPKDPWMNDDGTVDLSQIPF